MSRGRIAFLLASFVVLASVVTGTLSRAETEQTIGEDSLYKHLSIFTEVLSLVRRHYVEEPEVSGLFAGALYGTTDALDPLAMFVPAPAAEAFERGRRIGTRRSGLLVLKDRGNPWVLAVTPGGAGDEAGLRPGDLLAEIDRESARAMPLWRIRELLAGEVGSSLELRYQRRGQSAEATLVLRDFEPPPPSLERVEGLPLVRVAEFGPGTAEAVRVALAELARESEQRLLVDLRGAAGGDPEVAFAVAELFVGGPLGSLNERGEVIATWSAAGEPIWRGELVVLVSRGSQGAAEILATVLRQSAGAELVGQRTFGHAARQSLLELSTGARVLLSDAFYAGPDGETIDESLEPDEQVAESSRTFAETDLPLDDLILRRGIERLQASEPARRAA